MAKNPIPQAPTLINRQARFNYHLLETWVAGLQLSGSEVKSLRLGNAQLQDAYCVFMERGHGPELYVLNLQITPYSHGAYANHEAKRPRKLLLKGTELKKLAARLTDKGQTVVPTRLFFNDRGMAKLEIALAQGKKTHDKRDSIRERDETRARQRGED